MKKPIFYGILLLFLLSSCEWIQRSSGIVLDKETRRPIPNVYISDFEKIDTVGKGLHTFGIFTDSNGLYKYEGGMGAPDFDLYFDAKGYEKALRRFHTISTNDTILLEKK